MAITRRDATTPLHKRIEVLEGIFDEMATQITLGDADHAKDMRKVMPKLFALYDHLHPKPIVVPPKKPHRRIRVGKR